MEDEAMSRHDVSAVTRRLRENKTLDTLFSVMRGYGEEPAARWLEGEEERAYTFAEMCGRADGCAARLYSLAREGGWIALCVDTCPEWPVLFWGIMRSGHNALLLDAYAADSMVQSLMEEAGCRLIITRKPRRLPVSIRQVDVETALGRPDPAGFTPVWGSWAAMCTSGTTGRSRIFAYSGEALCEQALNSDLVRRMNTRVIGNENRRFLAFLPFHHVLGFMANVIWGGFVGFTNLYLPDRTPESILKVCQRFQPHLLVVVPLMGNNLVRTLERRLKREPASVKTKFRLARSFSLNLQRIAPDFGLRLAEKKIFASLNRQLLGTEVKCVILGGGHTPRHTLKTLNALGYSTITGFGMTETAITGFETSLRLGRRLSGSVGKALESAEYRVASSQKGHRPGATKEGELQIRGAGIHSGRLVAGEVLPPETLEGGWYASGDIVRMDGSGRIYIRGRLKDVIINESGENIYPDDLEDAFAGMKGVEQVCVVGLRRGRRDRNEDVTLVLGIGAGYRDRDYLSALSQEVRARNAAQPLSAQVGRVLVTPDPLPLAAGIKVRRVELKQRYADGELTCRELDLRGGGLGTELQAPPKGKDPNARHDEIRARVRALYAEALDLPENAISDTAHFIEELHGDSLQVLSMALKAEREWGVTIPAEEYARCATVESMAAVVESLLDGTGSLQEKKERQPVIPITRFEDAPEYREFQQRQEALASGGDNPYFVVHESPLLDTGDVDGRRVLEFGSYNYAGMSGRPEVSAAAKAAIDKYGTSASGSRLLAGEKKIHQELEKELAEWKHAEDAIVCVGGHSTNVTFIGNFCGEGDLILYDALAHNSIEQGCRLSRATARPFPHNDFTALESILQAQRPYYGKVLIVIEGVYSMDGDIAPLPEFVRVKKEYGCFLMVDEAHSSCVLGRTGGGVDEYFNLAGDDIDIKYGTLSKGLGTCGGYLAGKRSLIEYLRYNMPGFVFSVGISPALAAGSLEAIRLLRSRPEIMEQLHRAIRCFADSAKRRHLDICLAGETAVLPVLVGRDEDAWLLSNELKKRGVSVPPAMYPAVPRGKARLRFCVISEHKEEQIEKALDLLEETAKELGISLPRRDYT